MSAVETCARCKLRMAGTVGLCHCDVEELDILRDRIADLELQHTGDKAQIEALTEQVKHLEDAIAGLSAQLFVSKQRESEAEALRSVVEGYQTQIAEAKKDSERLEWWAANTKHYWFEHVGTNPGLWTIYKGRGHSQGGVAIIEGRSLEEVTDAAIKAKEGK